MKKTIYSLVVVVTTAVTLYLVVSTVYLNIISKTKGPVHWHADFEIWVCDKKLNLVDPTGFSNKIGTPLVHELNDNRIHIEGVILDYRQASLGNFFHTLGGVMRDDEIGIPTDGGMITARNGDKCNQKPANLYVFVNGNFIKHPSEYVIAQHERVPPGDKIKIVFTEKLPDEINGNLG